MSSSIVIERERLGFTADHELYLFRIIEPHSTGSFATLIHMRCDGQWHLVWYPNVTSERVKSFAVGSMEKGFHHIERWAAHFGASLPAQDHPGRSAFSSYEIRRL